MEEISTKVDNVQEFGANVNKIDALSRLSSGIETRTIVVSVIVNVFNALMAVHQFTEEEKKAVAEALGKEDAFTKQLIAQFNSALSVPAPKQDEAKGTEERHIEQ